MQSTMRSNIPLQHPYKQPHIVPRLMQLWVMKASTSLNISCSVGHLFADQKVIQNLSFPGFCTQKQSNELHSKCLLIRPIGLTIAHMKAV